MAAVVVRCSSSFEAVTDASPALLPQVGAFISNLDTDGFREFVIHDRIETSFTDFRESRIGRWNQVHAAVWGTVLSIIDR